MLQCDVIAKNLLPIPYGFYLTPPSLIKVPPFKQHFCKRSYLPVHYDSDSYCKFIVVLMTTIGTLRVLNC